MLMGFILISIFSCKNINQTTGPMNVPLDGKSYLSIPNKSASNAFRLKILNLSLREILQDRSELLENEKINPGEELGELKFTKKELEDYRRLRSNQAAIIVSYLDRTEIYFVPAGLSKLLAQEKLALLAEGDSKLYWAQNSDVTLEKGSVYFIANSNINEILANDLHFHKSEEMFQEIKGNLLMKFSSYQKVHFYLNPFLIKKELAEVEIRGRRKACTAEMTEAQQCEPCSFKIKRASGREIKTPEENTDFIAIKINDKEMSLNDLGAIKLKSGTWELILDFSKLPNLTHGRPIKLEWVQRRESQQNFLSMGYDYSENCLIRDYVENIDVTAREHIEMRTQIFGRNLEVESIKQ